MSLIVDVRFVQQVSTRLQMFKKVRDYLWNFRCPFCGDSDSKKTKARGYIFRDPVKQDHLRYKCHNCGRSDSIRYFLSQLDSELYKEYVAESFLDSTSLAGASSTPKPKKNSDNDAIGSRLKKTKWTKRPEQLVGCASLYSLSDEHPAKQYVVKRKIPVDFQQQLYWTDDFASLARRVCPAMPEETKLKENEGRIIIPLLDSQNRLLGIQGRTLDPNTKLRYITIKVREDAPKIYGMHRLGPLVRRVYVVEGPFDSMFLPDCIAMTGSDLPPTIPRESCILIYDNEPRNAAICKKMERAIQQGYRVVVWPKAHDRSLFTYKDINDMIVAGYTPAGVRKIIDTNAYTGAQALFMFQQWRLPQKEKETKPRKTA
jgi:transcription elongation factor Elf1